MRLKGRCMFLNQQKFVSVPPAYNLPYLECECRKDRSIGAMAIKKDRRYTI